MIFVVFYYKRMIKENSIIKTDLIFLFLREQQFYIGGKRVNIMEFN